MYIENNFFRYLYDCFNVWDTNYDIDIFDNLLNSMHERFKFVLTTDSQRIAFLDIYITINNNTIFTKYALQKHRCPSFSTF